MEQRQLNSNISHTEHNIYEENLFRKFASKLSLFSDAKRTNPIRNLSRRGFSKLQNGIIKQSCSFHQGFRRLCACT